MPARRCSGGADARAIGLGGGNDPAADVERHQLSAGAGVAEDCVQPANGDAELSLAE